MKHPILFVCLCLLCFRVTADPPPRLVKWILQMELELVLCKENLDGKHFAEAAIHYNRVAALMDSVSLTYEPTELGIYHTRFEIIQKELIGLTPYFVESFDLPEKQSLVLKTNEVEPQNILPVLHKQEAQIVALSRDTAKYISQIQDLKEHQETLKQELDKYTRGIFVGLGFGYNYFTNGPLSYYIKPDSTVAQYGKSNGMSFIFSGFVAYKINPKHSIIFNVPLGDITSRQDYRVGVFNKKMAGGLGYGYNMGSVSIIGIINISPYEELAFDLLTDEKFEGRKFSSLNMEDFPTTTKYSPSITIGFSYNFIAPNKISFENF